MEMPLENRFVSIEEIGFWPLEREREREREREKQNLLDLRGVETDRVRQTDIQIPHPGKHIFHSLLLLDILLFLFSYFFFFFLFSF